MTLRAVSAACRATAAGGGFLAGYLWAVVTWARQAGLGPGGSETGTLVAGGLFLSSVHAALVGLLFSPAPRAAAPGLRVVVAPAAFTVSFLLGCLGIRLALRLIG